MDKSRTIIIIFCILFFAVAVQALNVSSYYGIVAPYFANSDGSFNTSGGVTAQKIGGVIYADQYATLQDAVNASDSNSDGYAEYEVKIPCGNYASPITLITNLTVIGDKGCTRIVVPNNYNNIAVKSNGRINLAKMKDIIIQGNSANQASGGCIDVDAYYTVFDDVWAIDCKNYGIYLNSSATSGENRIVGGRYNATIYPIYAGSNEQDYYIQDVSAYGGTANVVLKGSGYKFTNSMLWDATMENVNVSVAGFMDGIRFGGAPTAVNISAPPGVNVWGIWDGVTIYNSQFSVISKSLVNVSVDTGKTALVNVIGITSGAIPSKDFIIMGGGTVNLRVRSDSYWFDNISNIGSTLGATSYFIEPRWYSSRHPYNPAAYTYYQNSTKGELIYDGVNWRWAGNNTIVP